MTAPTPKTPTVNCENCDRPKATEEDERTIPEGEGDHLCWNAWGGHCEPADWRGRALAAEAELARLRPSRKEKR